MEIVSFKLSLKSKWVVGLAVSLSLVLGVVHAQSNATSN